MERVESELATVKEGLKELRTGMRNEDTRMEKMESNIETIKEYLKELRELAVAREGNDKGKAPMESNPSPSYSPPQGECPLLPLERSEEVVIEGGGMNNVDRGEGESMEGNRKDLQYRRLKLPLFGGAEALDWISKVECHFQVNRLTELEKLTTVGVCMEGDALHWLQWRERHQSFSG